MNKRGLALLLSLAMIISMMPASVFASEFADMPNNWSTEALEKAASNGLLNGSNGRIMPNEDLSRAQMATIVNRAFGSTEKASLRDFTDVSSDAWYYDDMAKAVQMQTFLGSGNKLNPDISITREEAFVVLARALKLTGYSDSVLNQFSDRELVSQWANDGVASLVSAGYVAGSNGKLNPKENITRAEFAKIMDNLVKNYINKEGTYTSVEDGNVMINVPNVTLKDLTVQGDLFIGDGVGDGDVTLDNVTVTGRTVIRGGGENSIRIIGNSNIQNIVIARIDGNVRVFAEDGTEVGEIIVDGNDDVIIEGKIGTVTVIAPDITLTANNAEVEMVNVTGENSEFVVSKNSIIKAVNISSENASVDVMGKVTNINTTTQAGNATISVSAGAKVENIKANGEGTEIEGKGTVKNVEANADNIDVTTTNTKVTAAKGTTGVTAGGKEIKAGTTIETTENKKESNKGGSGGGGGGGGNTGEDDEDEKVPVSAISITTPPTKVEYEIGENLDLEGLVVTATYDDESTEIVEVTADMISGFDSNVAEENQKVTITYEGKTATFTVTILEASEVTITNIEDIAVTVEVDEAYTLPSTVTATMSDESTEEVAVTWDPATADTSEARTFTFNGTVEGYAETVTLTLTVEAPAVEVSAITITTTVSGQPYDGSHPLPNFEGARVTLTTATEDAEIYYTTDGSTPSKTSGEKYTGPFVVEPETTEAVTRTVKAVAVKSGYTDSTVATLNIEFEAALPQYTVTFSVVDGNGTIDAKTQNPFGWEDVNSGVKLSEGTEIVFTATPDDGYQVKEWKVDNVVVDGKTDNIYTLENLTADVNVTVEFEATTQTILAQEAAKYNDVRLPDDLEKGADITDTVLAATDKNTDVEVSFSFEANDSFKEEDGKIIFSKYRSEADHDIPVALTFSKDGASLNKVIKVTVPKGTGVEAGDSTAELTATDKLEIEAVGGGDDLNRVRVKLLDVSGDVVGGANFDLYADASNLYGDGQAALNSAGVTARYDAATKTWSIEVENEAVKDVVKVKLYFANGSKSVEVEDVVDVTQTPAVQLAFALGVDNTEVYGDEVKLINDVSVDSEVEVPDGVKLNIEGNKLTIEAAGHLIVNGSFTGVASGGLEVQGTIYASSFPAVAQFLANGGKTNFFKGSTLQVFDSENNRTDTFIGKDSTRAEGQQETMIVDEGHVSISINNGGFNLIIPSGSKATIKGYHMDGDEDGYRIAKADIYTVEGTLNINYRTEVSGKLEVKSGGVVNIAENKELYIFDAGGQQGSLWAYEGSSVKGSQGAKIDNREGHSYLYELHESEEDERFMEKAIYTWDTDTQKWVAPNPTLVEIDVYGNAEDIEVDFGTEEDDAKAELAQKIKIRDSYGHEHEVDVAWTFDNYDNHNTGNYTATGTFELPAGVDQADPPMDLKVTAKVSVITMQYASMELPEGGFDIEVDYGTDEQAAKDRLVNQVKIFSTSGVEAQVSITWEITNYNANEAADYIATGAITKPAGWPDVPNNVTATVTVKEGKSVFFVLFDASPGGIEVILAEFTGEHEHGKISNVIVGDFELVKKGVGGAVDQTIADIILTHGNEEDENDRDYIISRQNNGTFDDGIYTLKFSKLGYKEATPMFGDDFEISAAKSEAKAAIKPSWEVKSVEIAGTDLPAGVSDVDFKLTIGTSYGDKAAAQSSGRTVTTYFEIPEKMGPPPEEQDEGGSVDPEELGITVYYPVWKNNELTYEPARNGEVAFGMVGHPLSANNIEDDGVVYIKLDADVTETEFEFFIRLKDAAVGWEDVIYGDQKLEVDLEADLTYAAKNETTGRVYATIQAAIDDASGGHIIGVMPGTHAENIIIGKPLIIRGYISDSSDSSKPVIVGQATMTAGASGSEAAKTRLENLSFIVPENASGTYDSLILESAKHIVIKDCDFNALGIFAQEGGPTFRGVQMDGSCEAVDIDGCTFKDGYYIAIQGKANQLTIENSVVTNCESGVNIQHGDHLLVLNTAMEIVAKSPGSNAYCIRFGSASGTPSGSLEIFGGRFILEKEYEGRPNPNKYASAIIIRAAVDGSHALESGAVIQGEIVDDSKLLNLEDVLEDNTFLHKTIIEESTATHKIAVACTVTFDRNSQDGVTLEWESFLIAEGDTLVGKSCPNNDTPEGFMFSGWNTKADGSGSWFNNVTEEVWEDMAFYAIWKPLEYVASIGNTKYITLRHAVNAVQANETITLLADAEGDAFQLNKENTPFTIDLANKTYNINGNGITANLDCGIQISNTGEVVIKNGTITTDKFGELIHNQGKLTLDGVYLQTCSTKPDYPLYLLSQGTTILKGNTAVGMGADGAPILIRPSLSPLTFSIEKEVQLEVGIEIDLKFVKNRLEFFKDNVEIIIPTKYRSKVTLVNDDSVFGWIDIGDDMSKLVAME